VVPDVVLPMCIAMWPEADGPVPSGDDLVERVVAVRLREHDWNYGFIIDGFPATSARQSSSWRATTWTG
jgi:hypothetical protein